MSETLTQTRFRVGGMDCASCAAKVDAAARRVPGIGEVTVSVTAGSMTVHHTAGADLAAVQKRVASLGYTVAPAASAPDVAPAPIAWWRNPKAQRAFASLLALAAAWAVTRLAPELGRWAFTAAMLVGLLPIARRAAAAAFSGSPFSIETLMTIAAIGAVLIGAAEEAAVVVFLFLVGEQLEGFAAGRARASIQALADLVPRTVRIERDGAMLEIPAHEVTVGAVITIRPGDRIGADGEIIEGESAIDEAPITGESTPVRKAQGAPVFAGTINGDAVLRVRVLAAAADNTIARIIRLVEQAQESKAPTERFIDRFSRFYTPAVFLAATAVAIIPPLATGSPWPVWIYRGLALLLIGCPCALVISTPAAIAAALSSGARRGLLVKGGAALETLGRITDIALDKTGTLTAGKPAVTDIVTYGPAEPQLLAMAASLESTSSHPIAQAILARAAVANVLILPARDSLALPGKGIEGVFAGKRLFLGSAAAASGRIPLTPEQHSRADALNAEGKTVAVLLAGDAVAGLIAVRDEPRPDAREGIAALRAAGITPIMLTGDTPRIANAVAHQLGLDVRAGLLPEDKQHIIRAMQAEGRIVAKVGDGINDAPALAAADIGIAMGGGTDVALETADAAVLHGRVRDIAAMVTLSRATMTNIHQNIAVALGLKAVFLATTLLGVTGLWPAILADTGATVLVTLNALRLLRQA